MNLKTILDLAIKGYSKDRPLMIGPISTVVLARDQDPQDVARETAGDTLLRFVLNELIETYEPDQDYDDQVQEAINKIDTAIDELNNVRGALKAEHYRLTQPDTLGWYDRNDHSSAYHVACNPLLDDSDYREIGKDRAAEFTCALCGEPIRSAAPAEDPS